VLAEGDHPLADGRVDHEVALCPEDVRGAMGEHDVRALEARGYPSLVAVLEE